MFAEGCSCCQLVGEPSRKAIPGVRGSGPSRPPAWQRTSMRWRAAADRPMKVLVQLPEEKLTDVAIGVEIVDDFHQGSCAMAVLITNDADLRPAIDKVVQQGHEVHV